MTAISYLTRLASPQTINIILQASTKVVEFAKTYFLFISNICLVGLGFRDYTAVALGDKPNYPTLSQFFANLWRGITTGHLGIIQGTCFIASGTCGAVTFYNPAPFFDYAGSGLFLAGNLIALKTNIENYINAVAQSNSNDPSERQYAFSLMTSAALGIINNINYIMIPFVTLFGGPVALAIVFGGIALTTGCIKILYDYFYVQKHVSSFT